MKVKKICVDLVAVIFVFILLMLAYTNRNLLNDSVQKYFSGEYSFQEMADNIESIYLSDLKQKNSFINLNGLFVKLTGGRICNDIVRLDNGLLTPKTVNIYDETAHAESVIELSNSLAATGTPFLYVQAPIKIDINNSALPEGIANASNENANNLLKQMQNGGVSTIDLRSEMADTPEHVKEYFYVTDHHWTPLGGFYAFQRISEYIQEIFPDKKIIGEYQDIDNWNIHRKANWFLGSEGKRTGIYFAGTDDLIWLTPKGKTQISCANIYGDTFWYGDFVDANIRQEYIDECDYYIKNAYCVYIGRNMPLIQHRNPNASADMKILIIKDSFALPVQAFFSTVFSEVDVIDLRYYTTGTLSEYINDSKPDMVMMLVNPSTITDDRLFTYGLPFDKSNNAETNVLIEQQNLLIEASAENQHYVSIYEQIESGKQYIFSCDTVQVLEGETDGISLKVYDAENDKVYNASMIDIGYYKDKGKYEWSFSVPNADSKYLRLLIYAGIPGHTENISIQVNNISLLSK